MLSIALRRLQPSGANRLSRLFSSTTVKRSGNTAGSLADVCDLDQSLANSYAKHVLDGKSLPMHMDGLYFRQSGRSRGELSVLPTDCERLHQAVDRLRFVLGRRDGQVGEQLHPPIRAPVER